MSTRPWWKQPIVWFMVGLPASMVVIGFALLAVALRNHDDLVTSHPYEKGLQVGSVIAQARRAEQLKLQARISISGSTLTVQLDPALDEPDLELKLDHPFDASRDLGLSLGRTGAGSYSTQVELEPVQYSVQLQGRDWSLSGRWNPASEGHLWPGVSLPQGQAPQDD